MSVTRSVEWGILLGMRKIETVEQMPAEYRDVLVKIIHALASTEELRRKADTATRVMLERKFGKAKKGKAK